MKNLNDLLEIELKNSYALEKQSIETFEKLSIEHVKLNKEVAKIKTQSDKAFEKINNQLQKHSINPGNTIDQVGREILDNLINIATLKDIETPVKNAGLAISLNRYLHYTMANYQAVGKLAKALKMKKESKICSKQLNKIEKRTKKLNKLMKKDLFK